MNRKEEYGVLMQELEEVPTRLNYTLPRARAKVRRRNLRRWVGAPLTTLSAVCVAFVLLVNLSMPFAMACAKVPVLKDLAQAVAFSPSLGKALKMDWVQVIDQSDTDNDVTMTVEFLILDQKQLNVFYSLEGLEGRDPGNHYMPGVDLLTVDGGDLKGCIITAGSFQDNGELHSFHVEFTGEYDIPSVIVAKMELEELDSKGGHETVLGNFAFKLEFDPEFISTSSGQIVEVNEWIELDGQRICLTTVEIYPTHTRVNFESDPANTHWLRRLKLYAEDENGVRYDIGSASGVSASMDPLTGELRSNRLESSYFSEGEGLTIYLTGAEWLEKGNDWTWVDLDTGEAGPMPEWVTWMGYEWAEIGLLLNFRVYEDQDGIVHNPVSCWREPHGKTKTFGGFGTSLGRDPEHANCYVVLKEFSGNRVELKLDCTDRTECTTPIAIEIS